MAWYDSFLQHNKNTLGFFGVKVAPVTPDTPAPDNSGALKQVSDWFSNFFPQPASSEAINPTAENNQLTGFLSGNSGLLVLLAVVAIGGYLILRGR